MTDSKRKVPLCVLFVTFLCTNAASQPAAGIGRKIVDIQYSHPEILHPADLERAQPLKKGAILRLEDASDAIDQLFATGRFEDIAVETELSGEGVIVRFVTAPARFIGGIAVQGKVSSPPGRGEVTTASRLQLGMPFQQEDLDRATNRIQRLFTSNGLYEAQITPDVHQEGPAEQVFVTFRVKSGNRAKYGMPTINGDTKLSEGAILRATGWRIPIIHIWRHVTEARTRKGVQGVLGKYQKQDRLTARVELEKLDYDAAKRKVLPRLNINPGPKVRVNAVEAKVSNRVLRRYVPVFQERAVDNDLLVEGARNLRDYFQSKGYYDVDIDFRTRPVVNDEQIIEYVIAQGQRYKMAELAIVGDKYFSEDDLRERMFMQPASFSLRRGRYSEAFRKKDEENIANLYRANGFRDVKVTSIVDRNYQGKAGQVGVTVQVEEGPQWTVEKVTIAGVVEGDRDGSGKQSRVVGGAAFL